MLSINVAVYTVLLMIVLPSSCHHWCVPSSMCDLPFVPSKAGNWCYTSACTGHMTSNHASHTGNCKTGVLLRYRKKKKLCAKMDHMMPLTPAFISGMSSSAAQNKFRIYIYTWRKNSVEYNLTQIYADRYMWYTWYEKGKKFSIYFQFEIKNVFSERWDSSGWPYIRWALLTWSLCTNMYYIMHKKRPDQMRC